MANNRFITTRSNYTIKDVHKKLLNKSNDSTIYVRDYMTTTNLGGFDSGSIPYGECNFKFIKGRNETRKKKYKNGSWLSKTPCESTIPSECTVWTLNDLKDTTETNESKIVLKPNISDLLDFVYFGSCTELIKVSIRNIIEKYPGELYVTSDSFSYSKNGESHVLGEGVVKNPVVVDNPFDIDILTKIPPTIDDENNKLRQFSSSYADYVIITPNNNDDGMSCLKEWKPVSKKKTCYENGDYIASINLGFSGGENVTFYCYYFNGKKMLITDKINEGLRIRPRQSLIKKIFENDFSKFEQFLLNSSTYPKYTVTIKTPTESPKGTKYVLKTYTWPTKYGWNLDITSLDYKKYIKSLLNIATFYDENKTDNIWRNMTHDAIKKLDITIESLSKFNENEDDYNEGLGYIRGLLLAYGRQFDELKQYIQNIKATNNVTYSQNNNIPDYFLSDTLNLSGWEVTNINETLIKDVNVSNLFQGDLNSYDLNSANTQFLRNLKINSREIFSRKGTRYAIEELLSLFGLCSYDFGKNYYDGLPDSTKRSLSGDGKLYKWDDLTDRIKSQFYDYKLNEYVIVASTKNNDTQNISVDDIVEYNSYKTDAYTELNTGGVSGLPVKIVSVEYNEVVSGITTPKTYQYLIPWFSKKEYYDGNPYFQMYGGWVLDDETGKYEETKQYLDILSNIRDLVGIPYTDLVNGQILYVDNITDIKDFIPTANENTASHYFRLSSINYSNDFTDNENGDGWYNIPQYDIDNEIKFGINVIELEKIIDTSIGNNPHVGYGKYDSGESYLDYFRQIFKGAIETNMFTDKAYDCETGELLNNIKNSGFILSNDVIDNMKCWFFSDGTEIDGVHKLYKEYITVENEEGDVFEVPYKYIESETVTPTNVGKNGYINNEVFFETDLETYNFEADALNNGGTIYGGNDVVSANSVINVKKISIELNKHKYSDVPEFKMFFYKSIMPYLKQLIPSTTIMEIKYLDTESITNCDI